MATLKKSTLTTVKEWFLVTCGILIYVLGWSLFLIPNNLIGGGVSGISSMIQYATSGTIQMGYSYFVINAILVVLAIVILGMGFGAKTIYAIILASVALRFMPGMIPETIINTLAIQNGKLMSVLMGGLMAGIGIGMSISNGGSTGGTDIIALIYTKYVHGGLKLGDEFVVAAEDGVHVAEPGAEDRAPADEPARLVESADVSGAAAGVADHDEPAEVEERGDCPGLVGRERRKMFQKAFHRAASFFSESALPSAWKSAATPAYPNG